MNLRKAIVGATVVALGGCATAPFPFQLVDEKSQRHQGLVDSNAQRLTVNIGSEHYAGFYVLPSETYTTTSFFVSPRRFSAAPSHGTLTGNRARAHLDAPSGASLSCEFLVDGERAVGQCTSANGRHYQFVAGR